MTTGEPENPVRRTWAQVQDQALRVAAALRTDLAAGDGAAVLAADPALVAPAAQAAWLSGWAVTMLHQPTPRTDLAQWADDTLRTLRTVGARIVLLGPPFEQLSDVLAENGVAHRDLSELVRAEPEPLPDPTALPEETTALLQLTSGSTAEPKAVRITHGNLRANTAGIIETAGLDPDHDLLVSWLPLFHDMGMVGCLALPMSIGLETVKITPADFLARPLLWPELISRHRGTITTAPNFAYAITGRRLAGAEDGAFDLSSLRFTLNGAEPIDPDAVRAFTAAGARFGMRPEVVTCAFGMAEATLAVTFAPAGRGLEVDSVDADALERDGRAEPAPPDQPRARQFALLGQPLPGIEVRALVRGRAARDREVGALVVRGSSVTTEYLTADGPVPTRDAEGWLHTGDDGYFVDGQLVVCGRRKDVIIVGGRNLYPADIERAACEVEGVRAGNAAAVRLDAGQRRERFAVVVEARGADEAEAQKRLRKQIAARVVDAVGARPSSVVVLPPGSLPKTPSGKLRRAATAALVPER
jgi:fatty-acyl-CoA synthase